MFFEYDVLELSNEAPYQAIAKGILENLDLKSGYINEIMVRIASIIGVKLL